MPTMNGAARNGNSTSAARNANPLHSVAKHIEDMGVFAEMQFRQGKSLANRGEFQQAIAYLQRASDLANHQNADYLVELAQTFEQLDELDKAYQTYGRALTLKPPQLVALHYQRGIVAARQGKHELAVTDFAAVINSYAGAPPPDGAVRKLLANAFYRRGLVHQQWAKMPLAIQDLEQAIALDPQFADALFALGQLRFQAREFAPAEQAFQRALDAVTDFNDATSQRRLYTFHYALALLELGDQTASIASFTTVLEPVPGSFQRQQDRLMIDALFHRGRAHLSRQAHLAAIEDFSQVLAVDGHHIDAFRLRSDAFAAIGQHEQSESDVKNVLNREPDFAESFFLRALSRIGSAPKDAIADLNEAIRLRNGKNFPEAFYHRGLLRQQIATEIDNAIADFKDALSQKPEHDFARYQLGRSYELAGNFRQAIVHYTQLLNGTRIYPFVYEARARCHRALGDRHLAIGDLRKAKKLQTGSR